MQIGGSDQWGNILSGVDLIRRRSGAAVHGLCWPLLTAPDGTKLGKTAGARVWLSPERTSPYRFFQHWMQTDDRQVHELLAKFTLLAMDEVDAVAAVHAAAPERREGQRRLAREVTTLVHGPAQAGAAEAASEVLFGGEVLGADATTLAAVAAEVPTSTVAGGRFADGVAVVDLLVLTGVCASKSDARRNLTQKGVRINGNVVTADAVVAASDLLHGRFVLLRRGKANYHMVIVDPG